MAQGGYSRLRDLPEEPSDVDSLRIAALGQKPVQTADGLNPATRFIQSSQYLLRRAGNLTPPEVRRLKP